MLASIRMPESVATWLIRRAFRTPYFHINGYMKRFWLLGGSYHDERTPQERGWRGSWLDSLVGRFLSIRVHWILRSDSDRHFHDHPFNYTTVILRGGYWEVRPRDQAQDAVADMLDCNRVKVWHGPGSVIHRKAGERHILQLPEGHNAHTLFFMGPKLQPWGFLTPHGKIPWRLYPQYRTLRTEFDRQMFGSRVRLDTPPPPAHVNCRCFPGGVA